MITHSYAMDSQNKAEELASTILASSSSPMISAACAAVEAFLQKHSADQSRSFFSNAFPALICKMFGFDECSSQNKSPSSGGWIDQIQASGDSELAGRVFDLLSPSGVLVSSISAVDRHSMVKYVFPVERLPEWARFMLQNERECRVLSDLCPLFKGRIKDDLIKGSYVQLNVFEYYMFWFAYYPVCRGNSESSDAVVVKKNRRFRLENWTSSLPVVGGATRGLGQKNECSLYVRLLYAYLRAFVPDQSSSALQPYRSSLLHYSSGYDGSVAMQAEFLVYTLIHFWLVDNDFSPLPANVSRSFGVSFPFRAVLGDNPPTTGLGEVVKLFVKYLMRSLVTLTEGFDPDESTGSPLWRVSGSVEKSRAALSLFSYGSSIGSWTSLVQRPLYRFILRTFLFCPMETSIKNVSQVFSLWLTYIEPWKIKLEDFSKLDALVDQSTGNSRNENFHSPDKRDAFKDECQSASEYASPWQGFVLSNYLFYSSLVMHFLGFAHKFLHTDTETIIQMLSKVLNVLSSSRELMDLIKRVDAAFHSKPNASSSPMIDSLQKYVASIWEQLQDWEDGLSESDADGSFLHENWNQDLRLFSDSEDGGRHLLQLLVLRAESEIQAISGDNVSRNLQTLDSLKIRMCCLFGGTVGSTTPVTPEVKQVQHTRDEIFKPRRVGNQALADVKYKGDWMKRPVSGGEVAWLARLLVSLSDWLNEVLGLTQAESSDEWPSWPNVDFSVDEFGKVGGLKEALRMVLLSVGSCLLVLALGIVKFMKLHGLRVNLRVLASKKIIMVLLLSALFGALKKACGQCPCPPSCNLVLLT
ncbi:uncharacterized protein LOC122086991 [Macadamia integrifolia]|uniref:uncharacterized protein LOC122086991 n=1 Tax=Macadamia integrifolia TaxID=60698 RepID=UPI001C4EED07|nr:uncharacterized protein LOC122086991 [Macadamia integrifolia]